MSSVLETFYYMFDGDASKLDEANEKSKTSADELEKGLLSVDKTAEKMGASFLELAKHAVTLLGGALALGAIKAISIQSAEATNALNENARAVYMSATAFDTWDKAIVAGGGKAGAFATTMKNLSAVSRDPLALLEKFADRFKGLSDIKADRLADRLGIDRGMVEALKNGKQGITDLMVRAKELGVVTKEQVDVAKKYKDQLRDTNTVYDDVQRRVSTVVLPAVTAFLKLMERLTIWARDNKYFVVGFFGAIAAMITVFYLPAMVKAVVATYALLAPYLLLIGIVAAVGAVFALVYDDIMNFLDGNDSVIGELSKKWPIIGQVVRGVADSFSFMWDIAKTVFAGLVDLITQPSVAFDNFYNRVSAIVEALVAKYPALGEGMKTFGEIATGVASTVGDAFKFVMGIIQSVIALAIKGIEIAKTVGNVVSGVFGKADMSATIQTGKEQIAATNTPLAAQSSNSISNGAKTSTKSTSVVIDKVEIQTQATDAKAISQGIGQGITDQIKSAQSNADDGVVA